MSRTKNISTWNYRIVRYPPDKFADCSYGLHEVYYTNGVPDGQTIDAIVVSETPEGIVEVLEMMLRDAKKNLDPQDILDEMK